MSKALLVTTCLVLVQHQVCSTKALHGVKDYEVVYPQRIHSLHKRDIGGSQNPHTKAKYEDTVQYGMKVNGKRMILHLEKNKDLFSKDYTETHYSRDGREITRSPQIKDHCYYEGHIQNDPGSTASITACHGLRGYFKSHGEQYLIEPLKLSDSEEHAVFKYEDLEKNEGPKICGVTNTTWQSEDPMKKTSRASTSAEKQAYLRSKKYVELYIAADHAVFRKYSRNMTGVRTRVFEIVNYINVVYKAINVHIALIGLEIWSDGDKIEINEVAGVTLDRFSEWRQSVLLKRKRNDNAQLLTYKTPRDFSSCSLQDFQKYIMDRTPACITNMPLTKAIIATPVCGNDFVEEGEECDCGSPKECSNNCCEAATCKLKPGAKCGFGGCCDENCQLRKAGAVCRAAKHDCDLPELCTGLSQLCPNDRFRVNGYPCNDNQGYCYMGKCPTLPDQCNALFGPGASVAPDSCFAINKNGVYYGYCKRANGTFVPCAQKAIKCGKLYCTGDSQTPSTGDLVGWNTCKGSFRFRVNQNQEDYGMVAPGTKCGEGTVCYKGECMEIERAYRSTNCSARCKGHAVCDHELECQCEEGWAPPNCDDPTTNRYVIIIVAVLVVIVAVVVGGIIIWFQFLKKKQIPSIHKSVGGATNPAFGQQQVRRQQIGPPEALKPPSNLKI